MPRAVLAVLFLLALLLGVPITSVLAATPPQVLRTALSTEADAPAFVARGDARSVALPDDWAESRPRHAGPVWYRMGFDAHDLAAEGAGPMGLYIDRACGALVIVLNGRRLYDERGQGDEGASLGSHCDEPLLLSLPEQALMPQGNVLDLRLRGEPLARVSARQRAAGLSAPLVGAFAPLAERRARWWFWQGTLPPVLAGSLLCLALFVLLVGWTTTRAAHLLYFSGVAFGGALLCLGFWWRRAPLASAQIEGLASSLLPLVAAFAVLCLLRFADVRQRAIDVALAVQCLMVPASLALAGSERLFLLANAWNLMLLAEVLLAAAYVVFRSWRVQRREGWIIGALLVALMLGTLVELAIQRGDLDAATVAGWRMLLPLAFVAFGLHLMQIEFNALRVAELRMRSQVEQRVSEATATAERHFGALADLRVEQVTERERKRIAADLHDDLGAKLLTIVHTSESDRISSLAREALEEMRLSVRGLTGKPVRLADALGDWRAEVVSRLGQANIGADWHGPLEEPPQTLQARAYVQTTRILREAVSNIIKHSGAASCSFSTDVFEADFVLTIQDNGHGIPMELDGKLDRGHGMTTMKQRAKQLQGQCLVESGPGFGTVIRLTIPL